MAEKYRVNHGGLMRCCLESLDDAMVEATSPPKEGAIVRCKWCSDQFGMVFRDGAWRWAAPPLSLPEPESEGR